MFDDDVLGRKPKQKRGFQVPQDKGTTLNELVREGLITRWNLSKDLQEVRERAMSYLVEGGSRQRKWQM